ncbi:MAG: UDP-N-acetylmuramoyl-tripeptide--D-alanyl-D-alanine ligase [Armatimonadetes bacterium]|nr:MAG: UDP-N-acetylmuramoyl-tripeptide--D-alanyl-D-alanine ligase [Armatimonadota bacterium]
MSNFAWTLDAIAQTVGGTVVGDEAPLITGVTTDSRSVDAGDLFVPVVGERFDGHDFIASALAAGASATVSEPNTTDATPRVEVASVADALVDLAAKRRRELSIPVVAITGSTGKTSTKDLLASGITGSWASPRSYNNEVGVPLTVLGTPSDATALVVEVGSRGIGHIRWLARCLAPDVSVVTNLGVVHLETFGTEDDLANAKYELIELLTDDGVAVVPMDEQRLQRDDTVTTITFGPEPGADVTVAVVDMDATGRPTLAIDAAGTQIATTLSMAGAHQANNAAAAIGVAVALGLDLDRFVQSMAQATGSDWRMDVHPGRFTVVNDAYNANPQSVAAALETVAGMGGRSVAVLGPMAELGSVCESEHRRMGALAKELGFAEVIVVGVDHGYALGAPELISKATGLSDAFDTLADTLRPGDVVLVKASRSAGLERLALKLIKEASR